MIKLDAGRRMKVIAHVVKATATLSAIRRNTLRVPRTLEYNQRLDMLDDDLVLITARLTNIRPQDSDLEADLRGAVNLVQALNRVELESVQKDIEAAFLEYIGKS